MKLYDAANRAGDPVCWSLVTRREYLSSQREKDGKEDVQGIALDKVEVNYALTKIHPESVAWGYRQLAVLGQLRVSIFAARPQRSPPSQI
ncbi:hypothetical protein E6O75_ATG10478 [Venturia nashicola]|uniref:Uncharacterized protein n=1 Tax=Venturia nashicola TaxID=86259 RepID=A0A4Z1P710_9PEZI|nr:hypothetical protein E6O75_ATG10478 [Venturia nashicola]